MIFKKFKQILANLTRVTFIFAHKSTQKKNLFVSQVVLKMSKCHESHILKKNPSHTL